MPDLAEKNICVGCTVCANVCPRQCVEMKKNPNGFAYPAIVGAQRCVECGLCSKSCPVLDNKGISQRLPSAYSVLSKDEFVRKDSSSGGIFTELCKEVIRNQGSIYGAAYNESFEVHHICVGNEQDLSLIRGAKYSQSVLGNTFKEIKMKLEEERKVLFSGTPCQVAGLKSYLGKEYDSLICVDFVCHGVPSPLAWSEYVKYRSKIDNHGVLPVSINLRSKETGWSRYSYCHVFQYKNKRVVIPNHESLYMKLFVGDYINQLACTDCKFKGYSRVSDFTLGDFWGIWDIDPEIDDNKGTSVVLIHSEKGNNLFNHIKDNLIVKEVTLEQASQQNPSMLTSSKANPHREEAMMLIKNGKIEECGKFFIQKTSLFQKMKNRIKSVIK